MSRPARTTNIITAPTERFLAARATLPEDLRPHFDELVADYRFLAEIQVRSPIVNYAIMAQLVTRGWRKQS